MSQRYTRTQVKMRQSTCALLQWNPGTPILPLRLRPAEFVEASLTLLLEVTGTSTRTQDGEKSWTN
jgi:hypothetical protein